MEINPVAASPRPLTALKDSGLLWLINRVVFHPRGFALALHEEDGTIVGWSLQGDGSEPWSFSTTSEKALFLLAEKTLMEASS